VSASFVESEQLAYSWMKPMAQTLHTTTNHMRQPVEMIVRNMETFSAPVAKSGARSMRESQGMFEGKWDVDESHDAEVAEFEQETTCQVATPRE
jgi:hypothetical protein